ncbi:MAG: hypothetical protein ACP5NR_05275 [Athalassotoga sp.]|uniref:hypothetical protein n=1 Tax=Athalassotoga sp. TaxID=2022597 RepID=UPI003CFC959B
MIIEVIVALSIYGISLATIYDSISIMMKTMIKISASEKYVEDFEDALTYMYKTDIERGKELELISYKTWSVLLIDFDPKDPESHVVGYQLFKSNDGSKLRRIVAKWDEDIHKLKIQRPGQKYFDSHFSGFNAVYTGKEMLSFDVEGKYITFTFGKIKTYIGRISQVY